MKSNKTKKLIIWFLKAAAAGCCAVLILCAVCLLYFNVPVHYENESGATGFRWEEDRFYSRATEGLAWGRTNNEGFNNLFDYHEGDRIDILLMGTSHMDAMYVPQDETTAARLNSLFEGERTVYNIAVSAHTLMHNLNNLENALSYYEPEQYVIIECNRVTGANEELEAVLDNSYPNIQSRTGGLVTLLQKMPYLRLMYNKYMYGMFDDAQEQTAVDTDEDPENRALLEKVMAKAAQSAEKHGVKLIVMLDSTVYIDENRSCYLDTDEKAVETMAEICAENGIEFIYASEMFLREVKENMRLPYGFANTEPGLGHLNSWGHELLANCIYGRIAQMEG